MPEILRPETWAALPKSSGAVLRESYHIDFKRTVSPTDRQEMAKDVAVFANMFGGTLLIGGDETNDGVEYVGVPAEHARNVAKAYELAVRDHLSPKPIVTVSEIRDPAQDDRVVVAVVVEPFPDQPIGVATEPGSEPGWRFPIRTTSHTIYLKPEQLMLWTTPTTRRTAILLDRIPRPAWSHVILRVDGPTGRNDPLELPCVLRAWSLEENFVELQQHGRTRVIRAPLEDVAAVWLAEPNRWGIRLRGTVVQDQTGMRYYAV